MIKIFRKQFQSGKMEEKEKVEGEKENKVDCQNPFFKIFFICFTLLFKHSFKNILQLSFMYIDVCVCNFCLVVACFT